MDGFSIKSKIMHIDMSNFTLGSKISILENGKTVFSLNIQSSDKDEIIETSLRLAETHEIRNLFISPLAIQNFEKLKEEFKKQEKVFSYKMLDKLHYHMI